MSESKGFTLVEALVATLLTAMAVMTVAGMSVTAFDKVHRSALTTSAVTLAEQRIEWLRSQPFTSPLLAAGTTFESLTGGYEGYVRTTTIENDTPAVGIKQVKVTTTTPNGRNVQVVSLIAE